LDTGFIGHTAYCTWLQFTVALSLIHRLVVYLQFAAHALNPLGLLSHTSPLVPASNSDHSLSLVLEAYPRHSHSDFWSAMHSQTPSTTAFYCHWLVTNFILLAPLHTLKSSSFWTSPLTADFGCPFLITASTDFFSKSKLCYNLPSFSLSWCQEPIWNRDQFFSFFLYFFLESYRFVDVRRPLWREVGSVVFSFCWATPAESLSGLSPTGFMTVFYCINIETPRTWMARFPYLYPLGRG
jgi:hypothetical protein